MKVLSCVIATLGVSCAFSLPANAEFVFSGIVWNGSGIGDGYSMAAANNSCVAKCESENKIDLGYTSDFDAIDVFGIYLPYEVGL